MSLNFFASFFLPKNKDFLLLFCVALLYQLPQGCAIVAPSTSTLVCGNHILNLHVISHFIERSAGFLTGSFIYVHDLDTHPRQSKLVKILRKLHIFPVLLAMSRLCVPLNCWHGCKGSFDIFAWFCNVFELNRCTEKGFCPKRMQDAACKPEFQFYV